MTAPLPNCFSIWPSAASSAFFLFASIVITYLLFIGCVALFIFFNLIV
jgi:hypothetical protein